MTLKVSQKRTTSDLGKNKKTRKLENSVPKVGFVSLGCPKALVDSERIITQLRAEGYQIAPQYETADVVVVNTCGFLNSAKSESLEAIGEAMDRNGRVIVTGCMGVEEKRIRSLYPNILAVTGPHQYEQVVTAVHDTVAPPHEPFLNLVPPQGLRLTPRHYAYLKISEGCNNRCTFCIIPQLRGNLVSRPSNQIMREAEQLVKAGVKEILVISQDTSAYGIDLKYKESIWKEKPLKARFFDLSKALGELGVWIRLHYVYPYPHVDEVISLMADRKILPYLDIPLQHASVNILKAMRRPAHIEHMSSRIEKWRKTCPELSLRSTFIVGFPGETEEDFELLLDWLKEARINRAGCFKYEAVEGALANDLQDAVPEEIKEERWHRFMATQQKISKEILAQKVGKKISVLIDQVNNKDAVGRSVWDAPEIDGVVHVKMTSNKKLQIGDLAEVIVQMTDATDLWGTLSS